MPSFLADHLSQPVTVISNDPSAYEHPHRLSQEKNSLHSSSASGTLMNGNIIDGSGGKSGIKGVLSNGLNGVNSSLQSLPNGRSSGSTYSREKAHSRDGSTYSIGSGFGAIGESGRQSPGPTNGLPKHSAMEYTNGNVAQPRRSMSPEPIKRGNGIYSVHARAHSSSAPQSHNFSSTSSSDAGVALATKTATPEPLQDQSASSGTSRYSSPPIFPNSSPASTTSMTKPVHPGAVRLQHRHTLQVPRVSATRTSRDSPLANTTSTDDVAINGERFSPTHSGARQPSLNLARRTTRSIHSDMYLDEIPPDDDMARWTETIRQKRASRRKRKEEEEDDRVVVGTKVDMHHVNWVTAYNMLTGIRFTVSRTNAKIDRELTDADFDARHKFSFDITGNELTPSAKYDFKFKDYAPWVFRHLRAKFKLDPADYLISLTSKYILSELGSPGKSGSFFYFSRDYKYIIKTIHQAEHKLLRKILRDYYAHMENNPNSLISQFYGLHRVKIPYGRKIHFVVMNNLFPPHRDIHRTFDLKGSTIGRDFKEEDLERNPRATLKDLNWLRRNNHLEFGPQKKHLFIEQMKRDVVLLQKLKIMDYSLLVGIHDLHKGNEENLRDKTLRVFQPGGESSEEPQPSMLSRTPSKLETARKARQLRQIIKLEKPVPMEKSTNKMPDEMLEERKNFIFYSDDGGFRATHDDGQPGEEIYYLGIIDCLTHYGFVKRAEHFWKGMSSPKALISPIPSEPYGDRFLKFIDAVTMTREEAEREKQSTSDQLDGSIHTNRPSSHHLSRHSTDRVIDKAEKQAQKTESQGVHEDVIRDRTLTAVRSPSAERTGGIAGATLPVVEEVGEAGSTGDQSARSRDSIHTENSDDQYFTSRTHDTTIHRSKSPSKNKHAPIFPSIPSLITSATALRPVDD